MPLLMSQSMVVSAVGNGIAWSSRDDESAEFVKSGSSCSARAMAAKSINETVSDNTWIATTSTLDKASAVALDDPLRKRMSDVNWAI